MKKYLCFEDLYMNKTNQLLLTEQEWWSQDDFNFAKLEPIGFSKKGDETKIVSFGPKGGESDSFKEDDSGLL